MPILPEHKEILASQSASKTLPEWTEFFGSQYTKNQIYSFCYRNGYIIKKLDAQEKSKIQSNNSRKWNINQDFFKTWSNDMAYVLGFWWADGCIYGGRMFDITQKTKDKYIIKKIAEKLGFEGPIYDSVDRQASRINFSCVEIYRDLVSLGGMENKSTKIDFPDVPEEYLSDFIRGFFDGDGSVFRVSGGRINTAFTCASKKFIDKLWNILKEKANIEGGSYDASCYTLKFGNKDSIKLGNFMYKNNSDLFLLRKKNKFTEEF